MIDESDSLIQCITDYSEWNQEIDTPCLDMLCALGVRGVDVVARLMRNSIREGDESVASYCVDLLAKSGLPGSVEALTELVVVAIGSATMPGESLDELFDDAVQYDRFLTDLPFLAAAKRLQGRWNSGELDQFLAVAERRLEANP